MNGQTKQAITNAMKQLNDKNSSVREEGIKKLGEIGIGHPKIIERLQAIASDDDSPEVRDIANQIAELLHPTLSEVEPLSNMSPNSFSQKNESTIIELLQEQNKLLKSLRKIVLRGTDIVEEDEIYTNTKITDVDISISSLVNLMFKWIIASILVAILVWIIIAALSVILGGLFFKGF